MRVYEIPVYVRQIIAAPDIGIFKKFMELDEVGFLIHYDKEDHLKPDHIRRLLHGRKRTRVFIAANTPEEAIKKFFREYEGAKIGGKTPESKAMWIAKEADIKQMPHCKDLHLGKKEGLYICGPPLKGHRGGDCGEFGMCVIERYDHPDECPIGSAKEGPVSKIYVDGQEYLFSIMT